MTTCDKCGNDVPRDNDAQVLDSILNPSDIYTAFAYSRHLLPVEGCSGSPSRAQYIPGQPKDTRGYTYSVEAAPDIRAAYRQMQSPGFTQTHVSATL